MDRDYQIAMLWMRGSLSFLEQLCVQSFLDAGHHVALYSYEPIAHVPDGVELRDAGEILPEEGFLAHEHTVSPALLSDLFRYRLLENADRVIWADTDAYCRQRFQPIDGHLYGWKSEHHVDGSVLGLPPDSPTLHALLEFTRDEFAIPPWEKPALRQEMQVLKDAGAAVHAGEQKRGVWGPHAITHFLGETGEMARALPQVALYPYSFKYRRKLLLANVDHSVAITDETQSIHFYGRRIRKRMAERDFGLPHPESLIGTLLQKHKIDPCEAPLRDCPNPDRDAEFAKVYRAAANGEVYAAETPEREPAPAQKAIRPLDDVVAITTMKNEGPFILDWVAYHLSVGITHFLVYTNDCSDPTIDILDALATRGIVTRVDNPARPGERPQRVALALAEQHPRVTGADAYVVMDVDEYINIHTRNGTLADLFQATGDPDMISMTWRFFGSNGKTAFEDLPVAAQFTRASPLKVRKPHQNWGFKTLVRRGAPFGKIGVHRPLEPQKGRFNWVNGSGQPMTEKYRKAGWRSNIDTWGYDLVTLNHYATRSVESFLVKRDRGRTNHINRDQGIGYWNLHNRNDEDDASILPRLKLAERERALLRADPLVGPLHRAAVEWHKKRIATLKKDSQFGKLNAYLCRDPLSHRLDEAGIDIADARKSVVADAKPSPVAASPAPTKTASTEILLGSENELAFKNLLNRVEPKHPMYTPLDKPLPCNRIVIVSSMKNEGCFILEWIAHHLAIGVTHFLVYTNDCDDPTNAILDRLQDLGIVTRRDNPFNRAAGQKPQRGALNDAAEQDVVTSADWVGVTDVDEFITIHEGDRTLQGLFRQMNDPNIVSMTWRFFGNKGQHRYHDTWLTEHFTACAPRYLPRPRLGWGFKSFIHRSAPYEKLGVHRPLKVDASDGDKIRWVNGSGRRMPERVWRKNEWFSRKDSIGYNLVTLNHYVLRSAESFLVKRQRGRINHVDQDQGLTYWAHRNYATETDTSIHAQLPKAKEELARLMADETLSRLHHAAVDWHQKRIADLIKEDDYRALYDAITDPDLPDAIWRGQDTALAAAE